MSSRINLSFAFWNIDKAYTKVDNARTPKLSDPSVYNTLCSHDVICLAETHLGPNDDLFMNGYKIYRKDRLDTRHAYNFYGGLAICIRNELSAGIRLVDTECSEIMWCRLSREYFNLDRDIFLANVYVSPAGSSFGARNECVFEALERDVCRFSSLGTVVICGDFNARTKTELDSCHDHIFNHDITPSGPTSVSSAFHRRNMDEANVNSHGKDFLNFCKTTNVRIMNGRVLGDTFGKFTCFSDRGNPSVIDYFCISAAHFQDVITFKVHQPSPFSIHCILSTKIRTGHFNSTASIDEQTYPFQNFIWSEGCDKRFLSALSSPAVTSKLADLNRSELSVDSLADSVQQILIDASVTAQIRRNKKRTRRHRPRHKKWYDKDCHKLLADVRKLGRKLRESPFCPMTLAAFRRKRKEYKKLLSAKKRTFRNNLFHQLDALRLSNSPVY